VLIIRVIAAAAIFNFLQAAHAVDLPPYSVEPSKLTRAMTAAAELIVKQQLKDPDSAKFEHVQAFRDLGSDDAAQAFFVCGFVNAKNSYGGYSGNSAFMASIVKVGKAEKYVGVIAAIQKPNESLNGFMSWRGRECRGGKG